MDASYDAQRERTTITFAARRSGSAAKTTIEFGAEDLERQGGRLDRLINHPQFTIVPELSGKVSVIDGIVDATRAHEEECTKKRSQPPDECRRKAMAYADAKLQEVARRYRNPRHDSTPDAIAQDGRTIVDFLKSQTVDTSEEEWILFLSTAANEVGLKLEGGQLTIKDPIYGLSDAVDANSGLTFGAHQIDLGASSARERRLFWDIVDAYRAAHPDSVLDEAANSRNCLELPLRLMTVDALALTYRAAARMTAALRSADAIDRYNRRLLSYLSNEVRLTAGKSGLFKHSMLARVLFADLKNQAGSGAPIETLAEALLSSGTDMNSCASIVAAEDRILEQLVWNTPGDPSQGKTQYAYRYENIQRIVRSLVPHGGVTTCS